MPVEFDSARRLLELIEAQRRNPMTRMVPGIGAVLDELQGYIEGQELRWSSTMTNLQGLARVLLKKHYGYAGLNAAELAALQRLASLETVIEPVNAAEDMLRG